MLVIRFFPSVFVWYGIRKITKIKFLVFTNLVSTGISCFQSNRSFVLVYSYIDIFIHTRRTRRQTWLNAYLIKKKMDSRFLYMISRFKRDGRGFFFNSFKFPPNIFKDSKKLVKWDDTAQINGSMIFHIFEVKRWFVLSCMNLALYSSIPRLKS